MIRTFIAIDTPPEVKEKLAEIQEKLAETGAEVRWESKEKFHLTLKFLGGVEETKLKSLTDHLKERLKKFSPFNISYLDLGCFPSVNRPRVVWIGVENEDGSLGKIQEVIEEVTAGLGFDREERPFHAHITLGRVKGPRNQEALIAELAHLSIAAHPTLVEEILCKKSELRPTGSVYTVLERFPLTNT